MQTIMHHQTSLVLILDCRVKVLAYPIEGLCSLSILDRSICQGLLDYMMTCRDSTISRESIRVEPSMDGLT
jgi:hypothetical protein